MTEPQASTAPAPQPALVSVVMPALNRAGLLPDSVASVLSQTHQPVEVVLIDDGSTDDTWQVMTELARMDSRVRAVRHDRNRGAQAARNSGIRESTGTWLALLDPDDRYLPDSVERRLAVAARDHVPVVHSEAIFVTASGQQPTFGVPPLKGWIYRDVLAAPGPFGLLFHRELLDRVGELDESIVAYQEWDMAIRFAKVAPFGFMPEPTFIYDGVSPDAISRNLRRSADGYEQVVRKHRREILRVCGRRPLAMHYEFLVQERARAGDRVGALRCLVLGAWYWPISLLRAPRAARAIARSLLRGGASGG
jgi:glycosyltransferase involved in cell wall biosynthesis